MSVHFAIALALLATALLFQNCSKVKFAGIRDQSGALVNAKVLEIPVTGESTNSYENLNLVIILDDSVSMTQEQDKVKMALNEFLAKTKNKQAITTSVYSINHQYLPSSFIKYDVNGNELPPNAPDSQVEREKQVFTLRPPIAKLISTPDTTDEKFNEEKNKFFDNINSFLTSSAQQQISYPDVAERGLCTFIRYLKDSALSKSNDKMSFLIITDEDDQTLRKEDCPNYDFITYEPMARLDYRGSLIIIDAVASGVRKSDGGQEATITGEKRSISWWCNRSSDLCPSPGEYDSCSEEVLNKIKSIPSHFQFYKINTIDSCKMKVTSGVPQLMYLYNHTVENIRDVCGGGAVKFKNGGPTYSSYQNYLAYEVGKYLEGNPTCTPMVTRLSSGLGITYYEEFTDASMAPELIRNYALNKYGDKNVAINVVVYDKDDASCSIDTGSYGLKYDNLVGSNDADLLKKSSICSAKYDAVLAETNNLINWDPDRVYDFALEAGHQVVGVELLEQSGKKTLLTEDQYLIDGNKLTLNITTLPVNSIINIYYDKIKKK